MIGRLFSAAPASTALARSQVIARIKVSTRLSSSSTNINMNCIPSRVLCRLDEWNDAVLAEDLMILGYDHTFTHPDTPFARFIQVENLKVNEEYRQYMQDKQAEKELLESDPSTRKKLSSNTTTSQSNSPRLSAKSKKKKQKGKQQQQQLQLQQVTKQPQTYTDYLQYLDPLPPTGTQLSTLPKVYDRIPRLREISVSMLMPESITHSKKILLNGLLALQLITCKHAQIDRAQESDSRLKARKGMPIGVSVTLDDSSDTSLNLMHSFLEKFVDVVMPRIRDFNGFSIHTSGGEGGSVKLKLGAEVWQAFPEVEICYLKFPQLGSVGALPSFEIEIKSSVENGDLTRLMLTGFRVPFTFREPVQYTQDIAKEEDIHDV